MIVDVATAQPYQVFIGPGTLAELPGLVAGAAKVAIVRPETLTDRALEVAALLADHGIEVLQLEVPDAEQAKTPQVLAEAWTRLAEARFTRSDMVVGLGGGATTDLAGFLAASWLRGVGWVVVPTTVLGMVDAAVGGKTGINLPQGKNLVGAFHEPRGVICDLDLLEGLPDSEVRQGLAEVVKCGFIADPKILDLVEQDPAEATTVTSIRFAELVRRAIEVKVDTVTVDLHEATSSSSWVGREKLNYGHTLAHAIEQLADFRWRHGEAVSVGMVFAAELSHHALGLDREVVDRHRDVLRALRLPIDHDVADWPRLREVVALDKKNRGATLRFIGVPRLGEVELIEGPDEDVLALCHASVER
ncbi:3-dehydroquinate synthase [Aestuariimicrobium ganziense]|uniref:3-dehydroquinate synthase n=1 Tax=Aestuariimicrobium ganziense TaxID=2773677 RepID=UPI0019423698|nr:3-dehydroquinate synthase [Aestuariimicrobium ganziense]